jgi:hypothetical protein
MLVSDDPRRGGYAADPSYLEHERLLRIAIA